MTWESIFSTLAVTVKNSPFLRASSVGHVKMKGRSSLARGRLIAVEKREVGVMAEREAEANAHRRPAHFYLLKAKGVSQCHASLKTKEAFWPKRV